MDDKQLIESLNRMLAQEHACAIRYATHAAIISGPYSETVAARFSEIAGDEVLHAEQLRNRILALGGTPTMDVSRDDLKQATSLDDILAVNIDEEKAAIRDYSTILEGVAPTNAIMYQTILDIIRDEQEHLEELEALQPA